MNSAKQATLAAELERQTCSAVEPKNEREWWAHHEIERLRAELAEARRDVERYRWLRDHYDGIRVKGREFTRGLDPDGLLDAAIDAARKETP